MKHKKNWLVIMFDSKGEVCGPIWTVESKIKPTQFAQRSLRLWPDAWSTYKIKEVDEFSEVGYSDKFVKDLPL